VQLTKDKVPIIVHDEEIVVTTNAIDGSKVDLKVPVNKLKLHKIRDLKPVFVPGNIWKKNSLNIWKMRC
jgi:glycerophosphoryl diester phosphodiesterase